MRCNLGRLTTAFGSQGDEGWMLWSYGDNRPLSEMLEPGFFNPAFSNFKAGDLLLMGSVPKPYHARDLCRSDGGRMLLAMITSVERGHTRLRRLIDFGGPQDPDLPQGAALSQLIQGLMGDAAGGLGAPGEDELGLEGRKVAVQERWA